MIKSLLINKETLKLFFICSAVIGVSISYADFYMFHFALFLLAFFGFMNLEKKATSLM